MEYQLSELFDLQMGKTPDRNNPSYWNNNKNKWISIADLSKSGKYIIDTKETISNSAVISSGIKPIPPNTVVMSFKLSIGKTAITKEQIYSNEAIMAFIDKKIVQINPSYLYYLLANKKWDQGSNKAVMGITLNKASLSQYKVNIPNIHIQNNVVTKLDKLTQLIETQKKQMIVLDNLIKSRFVEMFGDPFSNEKNWEQEKIKDIAVGKLSYGSSASAIKFDNNIRYVRITDITDSGDLIYDKKSPSEYEDKYLLNDGDILFARSGATVGKTFKYSKEKHGKCIYAGYLIRLVPNTSKVIAEYVFWYTKTEYYLSFIKNAQKAVAQPNINAQEYGNLTICVPPIELQYQFAYFVEQVNKSKFVVQKSIEELQTLYDSLMQKYFG